MIAPELHAQIRRLFFAEHWRFNTIAAQLGVHHTTAKRFACEGVLRAIRADDNASILFEPPTGPLPRAHPGKRFRDRRRYPQCASHKRKELQYEA